MTDTPAVPQETTAYKLFTEGKVRFGDLDALGHANNNAVGNFFDDARIEMALKMGVDQVNGDLLIVVAKITLEFLRELHMFEKVKVGQRISRIGRSSFGIHSAVFRDKLAVATGDAVCVIIDAKTRKPTAIPDAMRKILEQYA